MQSLHLESASQSSDDGTDVHSSHDVSDSETLLSRPKMFRNRFLNFVRLSSVINDAAEAFFKSEIRRRLFVTAVLIVISRVGYFIPLPGFDRRLIPVEYLSFVSGSVGKFCLVDWMFWFCCKSLVTEILFLTDELGDFAAELKMSLFQLGISPQIGASILMQVLPHFLSHFYIYLC